MLTIGVDVHKKYLQVCVLDGSKNVILECRIANEEASVIGFFSGYGGCSVALEPSHNWGLLYDMLTGMGLDVHVCDAREARLIGHNRVKTDKNDAYRLALLLWAGLLPECYVPQGDCRDLRDLVRGRASLRHEATGIKNNIHAILSRNWVKHSFSDLFGKSGRAFLEGLEIGRARKMLIRSRLAVLDTIELEISELESEIRRRARKDLRAQLLMTVPGIAEFSALVILAEIGQIDRFGRAESLVNYAGLHPCEDSSGENVRRGTITKEGSKWLRWILVEAAQHTIRREGKIRDLYQRVLAKKGHNRAIVAAAREMLVSIYWMLTRLEPYRPSGMSTLSFVTGEAR